MGHLDQLAERIHKTCVEHGFDVPTLENMPTKLMLSVSELSEALEELRDEKPGLYYRCTLCGFETEPGDSLSHRNGSGDRCVDGFWKPEGPAVEIIDSIIRDLHMLKAGWPDLVIDEVMASKMAYNDSRPYKHGRVASM